MGFYFFHKIWTHSCSFVFSSIFKYLFFFFYKNKVCDSSQTLLVLFMALNNLLHIYIYIYIYIYRYIYNLYVLNIVACVFSLSQFLDINWTGLTNMLDIPGIKWVIHISAITRHLIILEWISQPLKCCHMTYFVFWGDTNKCLSHEHYTRTPQFQKCCSSC